MFQVVPARRGTMARVRILVEAIYISDDGWAWRLVWRE